jgi:hypothetical protein
MQKSIIKKGLVIGIIFLFVGVGVLSNASSTSISSSDKEIFEYEIEPIDDQTEIITFFRGSIHGVVYRDPKWYDIPIMKGWIEIDAFRGFYIRGLKKSTFPFDKIIFNHKVKHVYAPLFIGMVQSFPDYALIYGIAIGNIEWE